MSVHVYVHTSVYIHLHSYLTGGVYSEHIIVVGLSATLPNYMDFASFHRANWYKGLFMFDGRFHPVLLTQTFIVVKKPFGF